MKDELIHLGAAAVVMVAALLVMFGARNLDRACRDLRNDLAEREARIRARSEPKEPQP